MKDPLKISIQSILCLFVLISVFFIYFHPFLHSFALYDTSLSFVVGKSSGSNILIENNIEQSIEYNGHSYQLISLAKTWLEANVDCQTRGGYLVTIGNQEENNFVASLVSDTVALIGYTDRETEGVWKWTTNEPVTFTNWQIGDPSDAQEDYAGIANNGIWEDVYEDERLPYICEWDSRSSNILINLFPFVARIFLFVIICVLLGYLLNKTRIK
ncbi:MAG: C-type lectin domain-containing protein [Candidatus Hodarchaeales archaeon]|jgi:hypothetical protein